MKTRRVTKAEMAARVERVRELAAQGMSQLTIADVLGVNRGDLSVLMAKRGIKGIHGNNLLDEREQALGLLAAGASKSAAARSVGVSRWSVCRWSREAAQ